MINEQYVEELIERCDIKCDKGKCPFHFSSFNSYCETKDDSGEYPCKYGFAIASMKKQIPKKPLRTYDIRSCRVVEHHCVKCGADVVGSGLYCWKCGQALDWSDEK